MNALQDPSKKTSINSLLNPQDGSYAQYPGIPPPGLDAHNGHSHTYPGGFHGSAYPNNGSYALGPANWEDSKRRALHGGQTHRPFTEYTHHPQMVPPPSADGYPDQQSSRAMVRPRMDHQDYAGQPWHPSSQQQNVSNIQYGAHGGMQYSHERTGAWLCCSIGSSFSPTRFICSNSGRLPITRQVLGIALSSAGA